MKARVVLNVVGLAVVGMALGLSALAYSQTARIAVLQQQAENGDVEAMMKLGSAFVMGQDVERNMAEGVKWFERAALSGNSVAQENIGTVYFYGADGVPQDRERAAKWNLEAAKQGRPRAQYFVAKQYHEGAGVPRDLAEALRWYEAAAAQSYVEAENNLGMMYLEGTPGGKDLDKAFIYFQRAAEKNHPTAQFNLGRCYAAGWGVAPNLQSAFQWIFLAHLNGHEQSRQALEQLAQHLSEEHLEKAQEDAHLWRFPHIQREALHGDPESQYEVGFAYATGQGVMRDDSEAFQWFLKAAQQGNLNGEYAVGELYATGRGTQQDHAQALRWLQRAADKGDAQAYENLAAIYLIGDEAVQNHVEGLRWSKKLAEMDLPVGYFNLGMIFSRGLGVPSDAREAVRWYEKALPHDYFNAYNNLAWLLATTEEADVRNPARAVELANRAVELTEGKYPAYFDTLARAYFENGQLAEAIAAQEKAVALAPDEPAYRSTLEQYKASRPGPPN